MKRLIVPALTLGLAAALAGAAIGNHEASSGTAIVNINAVLTQVPEYVKNDSILGREAMGFRADYERMQASMQAESDAFNQRTLSMSPVQKEAERKKLQTKADSIQAKLNDTQQKLSERRDQLLGPIEDKLTSILEGLRAEGNYSVVLNLSSDGGIAVVAADKAVNLTEKAIERIKAASPAPAGKP